MYNRPNCAAPRDLHKNKCEYCGTWFDDDLCANSEPISMPRITVNRECILTVSAHKWVPHPPIKIAY